ncbi:hypothetical protein K4L44_06305 [Halosquirtibacter laminarini]|uniref:Uncharacterized protein n=1 Tax=Halosquirtibacter laminarini TaxID=3374600 RepID=A0AC61NIA9_9BACT|nr:hypothetical protein K4L44_06305 [Prolixibacteraceae bacterium]
MDSMFSNVIADSINSKTSETPKQDPPSQKTIRKTVRITGTPPITEVKEKQQGYKNDTSHTITQHTPNSILVLWNEIMMKLKEPTDLVFFQQHKPILLPDDQIKLEINPAQKDIAESLLERIEKYYTIRTKINTKLIIEISEGSRKEQEQQKILNDFVKENGNIQELIQDLQLHFD